MSLTGTEIIVGGIFTVLAAVFGCGGFWEWRRARNERFRQARTSKELEELVEHAVENSETLKQIKARLDENSRKLEESHQWHRRHEEDVQRYRLLGLRQSLMQEPHDRLSHEHQLEAGKEYLASGGNGIGHARYDQLLADYKWRLAHGDWDYTHRPHISTHTDAEHSST